MPIGTERAAPPALRVCSPHCGLSPETTSGGETYEREILTALARLGVQVKLLLARGKPLPEGVPHWLVHDLLIRRGLRRLAPVGAPGARPAPRHLGRRVPVLKAAVSGPRPRGTFARRRGHWMFVGW